MRSYIFHINFFDLALLSVVFTGMGIAGFLWHAGKSRGSQNRILAMAMISAALSAATLFGRRHSLHNCPLQPLLGLGPLLLFYVRKITKTDSKLGPKDLLHILPLLVNSMVRCPSWFLPVSTLAYLYAANTKISANYSGIAFLSGDRYRKEWLWLQGPLYSLILVSILSLLFETIVHFLYRVKTGQLVDYFFEFVSGALMIWLSCRAFFRSYEPSLSSVTYLKPRQPDSIRQRGIWLKRTIKYNRYYQDPELSLKTLAAKMEIHPNELSRIINTVIGKSFNDLINEYRVMEVCRKMQDPCFDHLTLLGIAYESGFNAKTTFNRVFKHITGKSPADYKKTQEKERPNHNMGRPAVYSGLLSCQNTVQTRTVAKQNRYLMLKIISGSPGAACCATEATPASISPVWPLALQPAC